MTNKRTSHDFLIDRYVDAPRIAIESEEARAENVRASGKQYSDAELYRIIVARAIHEGRFQRKEQFDLAARELGTIEQADAVLAILQRRPGCEAWRRGVLMVCECGASWEVDNPSPPACKKTQR